LWTQHGPNLVGRHAVSVALFGREKIATYSVVRALACIPVILYPISTLVALNSFRRRVYTERCFSLPPISTSVSRVMSSPLQKGR
jgi:hypothetical protein